ncbi:MAG TPA: molybdopterin converting factor subunit 1 [Anaerolineales bacterium]|jgi:molybdopterin synthase catalytic subunit
MNKIKVLFFATLRERAGTRSLDVDIPGDATVRALKDQLAAQHPNLSESLKAVLVTINREFAFDEAVIPRDAEIAIFPPVSGG